MRIMILNINKEYDFLKLISWVLTIGIAIYIFYLHFQTIFFPYPNEFREGHMMGTTDLLLKGINPFGFDSFPNYYNSYGIFYSLVVYPFALIFGNSLEIHRLVNELFIFATFFIIYLYHKKTINKNLLISLVLFLLYYSLLLFRGTCGVRPDSLGMFLFISSIIIPIKNKLSNKSLVIGGVFAILAFYTKSYFLIGWIAIAFVVLINKNYKQFIFSNLIFGTAFLIIAYIVSKILPLYFYETLFAYNGSTDISLKYSLTQMVFFIATLSPLLIVFTLTILEKENRKDVLSNLIKNNFIKVCVVVFILLIFPLGINNGAFVIYHYQLLLPILILLLIPLYDKIHYNKFNKVLVFVTIAILSTQTIYFSRNFDIKKNEWNKVENYLKSKENVLNSIVIAPLLIIDNKTIYNSGVTGFIRIFKSKRLTEKLFNLDSKIEKKIISYFQDIDNKLNNNIFDAIVISKKDESLYDIDKIKQNYYLKFSIKLPIPLSMGSEEIFIYEPKK